MKELDHITPELVAKLGYEEKHELMLLLEELGKPKLARVSELADRPGWSRYDSMEAARKRLGALTPEQRAEEQAQRERDEDELLEWVETIGKDVKLDAVAEASLRLAMYRRNPPADPTPVLRQEWEAVVAARAAAAPVEVKQPDMPPATQSPASQLERNRAYVSVYDIPGTLEDIDKREEAYRAAHPVPGGGWGT